MTEVLAERPCKTEVPDRCRRSKDKNWKGWLHSIGIFQIFRKARPSFFQGVTEKQRLEEGRPCLPKYLKRKRSFLISNHEDNLAYWPIAKKTAQVQWKPVFTASNGPWKFGPVNVRGGRINQPRPQGFSSWSSVCCCGCTDLKFHLQGKSPGDEVAY